MMPRRMATLFFLLTLQSITLWAAGADIYAGLTDWLDRFKDSNTGLTSFPTLLIPLGGLSEGMGTAYAAVNRDAGFIESNPAASSLMNSSELALYHHSWIADSNLEGVVYTIRFNDLGIGFGGKFLYVPFTAYKEWGAASASDYYSETVATLNVSYNFFSSYYFYGVALGMNLKAAYRSVPAVFAQGQSAFAVMADVGAQTSFNFLKFYSSRTKNFSIGLVAKNVGVSTLPGEVLPMLATAGLAWSPLRPWTVAVDFNLPLTFGSTPAEVWNLATGTTVAITDFLSVQAGLLWKADNPRISVGSALSLGNLALTMNYNLDLSGSLNPLDKFSVQAQFNLGDSGRGAQAQEAEALYLQGVEEYANGNLAKAISLWEEVLQLDPKYIQAAESIATLKQTLAIQEQLQAATTK
jgi:tetratricopeptide (TPR) repeat protein